MASDAVTIRIHVAINTATRAAAGMSTQAISAQRTARRFDTPGARPASTSRTTANWPARHAAAARALAEEYFDSDKVLGRLVERALNREGAHP